jgi:hypothetical protein
LAFEEVAPIHCVRVGSSERLGCVCVEWIQIFQDSGQFWIFMKETVMIVVP